MTEKYAEIRAALEAYDPDDTSTWAGFWGCVTLPTIRALLAESDALREALTELCDEIDKHEIHAALSKTSISWFKRKARVALTQGEV